MPEQQLDRHQHRGETEAHAQHDARLRVIFPPQEVPRAGRGNAESTGQVGGEQHVRKSRPDHRVEDNFGPVVWNEGAIFHDVA